MIAQNAIPWNPPHIHLAGWNLAFATKIVFRDIIGIIDGTMEVCAPNRDPPINHFTNFRMNIFVVRYI